MLKFLIEAFKASKGRMPNNLEMLLLKQKAAKQSVDERKVVSMFDRSAVNPNKPILGGKNIPETEDDIRRRLLKNNEKGLASMKSKLDDPEKKADGGRIGYKVGAGKKGVEGLIDLIRNKFGKKSITTVDKAPIPPKTLERDMFKKAEERFNKTDSDIYEDNLKNLEDLGAPKLAERFRLKRKYPGITDDLLDKILIDDNIQRKAEVLATMDEVFRMLEKGKGTDEILDTMKNVTRTKQADGGITRVGYKAGSVDKMRRLILKAMGAGTLGVGAAKSGIFSFGKTGAKEVAKEVVKQSAGTPPPYFFKLAEKIKMLGDDATATTDRTIAKTLKSKDGKSTYVLEEDVATGDTIIKKINKEGDEMITDVQIMELRKGEVVKSKEGKVLKTPDEYEEVTEANMRIEGDTFNDPYYSDGIEEIEMKKIIDEVGDQAPSIKKADGGIMRAGYQMGGDVSYDATDPIYGSSAATFTPDTVMDQFGNQVQSEMGNDFNKPLIPQVTEEVTQRPTGNVFKDPIAAKIPDFLKQPNDPKTEVKQTNDIQGEPLVNQIQMRMQQQDVKPAHWNKYAQDVMNTNGYPSKTLAQYAEEAGVKTNQVGLLPVAGGGGLGGIDMPIAGGNKNAGGILPVMPQSPEFKDDTNDKIFTKQPVEGEAGKVVGNYNDPLPQDQLMAGFAEWKRNNPDKVSNIGHMAISYMTLPNGEPITFSGGAQANNMARYLESIGQPPMTRNNNQVSKPIGDPYSKLTALASGGIARMLGE